jgi:hypothetical protein
MNRYVITVPRKTFIVGAIAMTALTLGASIAPARMDSPAPATATVAYVSAEQTAATEVEIVPARLDVVGAREPRTVFTAVRQFLTRKPQST